MTFEYSFLNNLYKLTAVWITLVSFIPFMILNTRSSHLSRVLERAKCHPYMSVLTPSKGPALELEMESLPQRIGKWAWLT